MIAKPPTLESAHTKIWDVREEAAPLATHVDESEALGVWLVHAPWMHMLWSWHYVGLVHLRDIPGQSKAANINVPGATHEFLAVSMSPDYEPTLETLDHLHLLSPIDISQQFIASSDADALERVERTFPHIVAGKLSLDEDFRRIWRRVLLEGLDMAGVDVVAHVQVVLPK